MHLNYKLSMFPAQLEFQTHRKIWQFPLFLNNARSRGISLFVATLICVAAKHLVFLKLCCFLTLQAVGMNAKFFKLGAPCRGEKIAKLNRLLGIEAELEEQGKLEQWDAHTYPLLKPPTPPPEGGEEGADGEEGKGEGEEKTSTGDKEDKK